MGEDIQPGNHSQAIQGAEEIGDSSNGATIETGQSQEVSEMSAEAAGNVAVAGAEGSIGAQPDVAAQLDTVAHDETNSTDGVDPQVNNQVDESTAWDMAHSAKKERDERAEKRKPALFAEKYLDDPESVRDEKAPDYQEYGGREGYELIQRGTGEYPVDVNSSSELYDERSEKRARDNIEERKNRASVNDEFIEQIETWAGILHDHPVGESFAEAHPDVDMSARGLAKLESAAQRLKWQNELFSSALANLGPKNAMDGILHAAKSANLRENIRGSLRKEWWEDDLTIGNVTKVAFGHPKSKHATPEDLAGHKRFQELLDNPDTTLGQLLEYYKETFKKGLIDPRMSEAASLSVVLEDIKSGRASEISQAA